MTTNDAQVLMGVIIAIGVVFFLPRPMTVGPLTCAWIGGGIGLCLAFFQCYREDRDRLYLEDSVPRLLSGMFCGGVCGFGVMNYYLSSLRRRRLIEIVSLTFLFGTVGAVFGSWKSVSTEGRPVEPVVAGVAICSALGFVLGVLQSKWHYRRSSVHIATNVCQRPQFENNAGTFPRI